MQPPAPRDNFRRASAPPNAVQRGGGWRGRRRPRRGLRKGAFSPAEAAAAAVCDAPFGGPFIRRGERGRAGRHRFAFAAPAGVHVCARVWSGVTCVWYAVDLTVWRLKKKGYKSAFGTGTALGFSRDHKTAIMDCCEIVRQREIARILYSLQEAST